MILLFFEQYKKTSYYRDWLRLGLISSNDGSSGCGGGLGSGSGRDHRSNGHQLVKATKINQMYSVVPSYPGLFLVPSSLAEEKLKGYGRFHKQNRVPTITWKHQKNNSLLLRGSSFQVWSPTQLIFLCNGLNCSSRFEKC